jgi:hypothetical protein
MGMIMKLWWNDADRGKQEITVREELHSDTLSTKNPT